MVIVHQAKPNDAWQPTCILGAIALAFRRLGYGVRRWRSAYGEEFPYNEQFEHAVFWGGNATWFPPIKAHLMDQGTDILYAEVDDFGLYRKAEPGDDLAFTLCRSLCPNAPNIGGVCGYRDWRGLFFNLTDSGRRLKVRDGDLLVIMQDEVNLNNHRDVSPFFQGNADFVKHMIAYSRVPVRVRKHPDYPRTSPAMDSVEHAENACWDDSPTIEAAIERAQAVAVIDSHCGVRAMQAGIPVLCYGMAIYRLPGLTWRCSIPTDTTWYTGMLRGGTCDLDAGRIEGFLRILTEKTWYLSDLPDRLDRYLRGV